MASTVMLNASGLNTSPNQLELPQGSLVEANNVIIKRDNTLEPVRGQQVYGTAMGTSSNTAKQLFVYRNRILRHYSNILEFQNGTLNDGTVNFTAFAQPVDETTPGLRIKAAQSNGNFYFTSAQGIQKISAKLASDLVTAQITTAGGIKAVDFTATLDVINGDESSFLPQDSAVAYEVVWGTKDANGNLILGTPSQTETVFNPLTPLILRDFLITLRGLDGVSDYSSPSLLSDGNYVNTLSLPLTATSDELQSNLVTLASKIDKDLQYADQNPPGTAPLTINAVSAVSEIEQILTVADVAGSLNNKYFTIDDINSNGYYVWFDVNNLGVDPNIAPRTGVKINLATGATANTVASTIGGALNGLINDPYACVVAGNQITITHNNAGVVGPAVDLGVTGFTFSIIVTGTDGISTAIISGIYTINFSSGNPTQYFDPGSLIYLTGFTPSKEQITGTLSGTVQTIVNVTSTSISINTTATGPVNVDSLNAIIESGFYRNISIPAVPNIPSTNQELVALQKYLSDIIIGLQSSKTTGTPPTINITALNEWLIPISLTTTASVTLNVTIPSGVNSNYFVQVYRSAIEQATDAVALADLTPSAELQLVYEAYPTTAELAAGNMIIHDVTPDAFRGANLYTNPASGDGTLSANDVPPFAQDINRFKNVMFYANTRTRHSLQISLLGVQQLINDFNMSIIPKLSIIENGNVFTYTFVLGVNQETNIACNAASTLANSGTASYFTIHSANNVTKYYVWYKIGTAVDPAVPNAVGIQIELIGTEPNTVVAQRTANNITSYPWDFNAVSSTNNVLVEVTAPGTTTATSDNTTGFIFTTTQTGVGEDAAAKQILLSSQVSVALAVDETARSIVRVINKNSAEAVYAYYISGSGSVPGQILLQNKSIVDNPFYILANDAVVGKSFNPDISGDFNLTSITIGLTPTITTNIPHGLTNGDSVVLAQTNSTPGVDGIYTVYGVTSNTFQITLTIPITIAGTSGVGISTTNATVSTNDKNGNRVYYSKLQQPEAVPILNFLDVGDSDKEIVRIFPLRDSLFVFKQEGLYRISGEVAPFTLQLFDSSCQLSAPDTLDVNNNLIYGLTTQGIMTVSEGGVNIISRPIDNIILSLPIYKTYQSLSFGVGYESDNSYTLWTVQSDSDTSATIGYRYSNLTNSWTKAKRPVTCGIVNTLVDDKTYYGAGDINFLEQERKDFSRTDYAGRNYTFDLLVNNYLGNILKFPSIQNIEVGDVFVQTQLLTAYEFNMLLKKLDNDPGLVFSNYYSTLQALGGDNLRTDLEKLTTKLDLDPGIASPIFTSSIAHETGTIISASANNLSSIMTSAPHNLLTGRNITITGSNTMPTIDGAWDIIVTSPTTFTIPFAVSVAGNAGTYQTNDNLFKDIAGSYNITIQNLNSDTGVAYSNYKETNTVTPEEVVVIAVDKNQKLITVNNTLLFIAGEMILYKAIPNTIRYAPNSFGSTITYKHVREATIMFESMAFTNATLSFATDLLPELIPQEFNGDGNGVFGLKPFGANFFGGASHAAPFRTYIPRQCQRCRYMTVQFDHSVAREFFRIFGTTLTGEDTGSTRAYRGT